jgi:hypothetical protein
MRKGRWKMEEGWGFLHVFPKKYRREQVSVKGNSNTPVFSFF